MNPNSIDDMPLFSKPRLDDRITPTKAENLHTLEEAREFVKENRAEGVACPCCDKLVVEYKRSCHAEAAAFLVQLVGRYNRKPRWYHTKDILRAKGKNSTDAAYLVHWGLMERKDAEDDGRRGGMYRPTDKGIAFAMGLTKVPRYAILYNNKVLRWSENMVDIRQALAKRFNYHELLSRKWDE